MIYKNGNPPVKSEPTIQIFTSENKPTISEYKEVKTDKKETLIVALNELKSKAFKSKQDKESIQIIEAVLQNER